MKYVNSVLSTGEKIKFKLEVLTFNSMLYKLIIIWKYRDKINMAKRIDITEATDESIEDMIDTFEKMPEEEFIEKFTKAIEYVIAENKKRVRRI